MHWRTDTVQSTLDTGMRFRTQVQERTSQRVGKTVESLVGGQIVGINIDQVPTMRGAIENYCQEIERYLRNLNPTANLGIAIKSPIVQKAVSNYMNTVVTYCSNLVSQLRAFSDKLADVASKWNQSTENMAQSIGATNGDAFAKGASYTNQIQSGISSNVGSSSLGGVGSGAAAGALVGDSSVLNSSAGNGEDSGVINGTTTGTENPQITSSNSFEPLGGYDIIGKDEYGNDIYRCRQDGNIIHGEGNFNAYVNEKLGIVSYDADKYQYTLANGKIIPSNVRTILASVNTEYIAEKYPNLFAWLNDPYARGTYLNLRSNNYETWTNWWENDPPYIPVNGDRG